jgi:hypothetical protein
LRFADAFINGGDPSSITKPFEKKRNDDFNPFISKELREASLTGTILQ